MAHDSGQGLAITIPTAFTLTVFLPSAFRRFLLEWMSFLCRYVPVGLLEVVPQRLNWRPPFYYGRSDLETLLASQNPADWVGISEMLLGPPPPGFRFEPKHKSNAYAASEQAMALTSGSDALENG